MPTTLAPQRARWPRAVPAARPAPADPLVWGLVSALLGLALSAIVLAMSGVFRLVLVVPLAAAAAVALYRCRPRAPVMPRVPLAVRVAACAIAALAAASNAALPGEHLLTGRDGATYANTAAWIARTGQVTVDARPAPFADPDLFGIEVAGFSEARGDGRLFPQFLHAFPALLATGSAAGGIAGLLSVNGLLSGAALLAVFAFGTTFMRPWGALLAEALLAVNLVFVYFARAPFSETLTLAFVFAGLWALHAAQASEWPAAGFMAGLLLGGAALVRLDGLVIVLVVAGYLALRRGLAEADATTAPAAAGVGAAVALALVDLFALSPQYVEMHTDFLWPLAAAAVLLVPAAMLPATAPFQRAWRWAAGHGRQLGLVVAAAIVLGGLYAYAVRPLVEVATWDLSLPIGGLQAAAGHAVDENRTYGEWSLRWLGWYTGPAALLAAFAGWAALARRAVLARAGIPVLFLAVFSGVTVLYLWQPSITPGHVWAMRRYLPVTLPGLALLAAWSATWVARRRPAGRRLPAAVAAGIVALALAVPAVAALAPVATLRELDGMGAAMSDACERLGDDAAVLVLPGGARDVEWRFTQGFRSFCGLPTARAVGPIAPERLRRTAAEWAQRGRTLYVVASDDGPLAGLPAEAPFVLLDESYPRLESTLMRLPAAVRTDHQRLVAAAVR